MRLSLSLRLPAAVLAAGLLGAALAPARAADLDRGWGGPPPPQAYEVERRPPLPPPPYGPPPRFVAEPPPPPPCRMIVRRHVDPYGDEVVRRVRVCDGPPRWYGPPGGFGPRDGYGPPPPWRGPRW